MLQVPNSIVSVEWLYNHLDADNLIILDASIPKVTVTDLKLSEKKIPNTRFFDLKQKFSDVKAPFPNTFPSAEQFQKEARLLGINNHSAVVVYDDLGIYSSPRAWWLFKAFGYDNVAVLNGGLPAWKNANYPVENSQDYNGELGNFVANLQSQYMKFFEDVKKESKNKNHKIIDARSEGRFKGIIPEPREGLRSGTIPNSLNLPFDFLLENGQLKNVTDLKAIFNPYATKEDTITFSCGSGITACVLALGAEQVGYKNISVYDGSWTEWGSLTTE